MFTLRITVLLILMAYNSAMLPPPGAYVTVEH